jgi:hypothetical protein
MVAVLLIVPTMQTTGHGYRRGVPSQEQLDQVELLLNQRPRKPLGFHTPASKLQASVASAV